MRIGVLALQGAFIEHIAVLKGLGIEALPIRLPEALDTIDGLIIPGGESTTILKLMHSFRLLIPLRECIKAGMPVLGTCAGMICLAKKVNNNGHGMETLMQMDIEVRRNAFGRQVDSFEADLKIPVLVDRPLHAIFIRAPIIESTGPGVEILARLPDGTVVAARQRNMVVTSFHPELTDDPRFHSYFISIVSDFVLNNTANARK
jgi:pyridoxal 5'-phosphate synthase pdxT subunit